jgi:very-short-patch-repair endonuclease
MQEQDATPARTNLTVEAAIAGTVNLALYENAVPVLRELTITGAGTETWTDLRLEAAAQPPFIAARTWHLSRLGPGERHQLTDLDLVLDGALLAGLTEARRASVSLRLTDADGRTLAQFDHTLELLAANEWAGVREVPELLAAFVQPNDPAVEALLKDTAQVLRDAGRESALDGYQSASRARVWELASALWTAVSARDLDYAVPPASFERTGQKVRSPTHVLGSGLGTCLDLTVLFAAALEQMGLNALVVLLDGHCFVGCWLREEELATAVVDDVTTLRRRIGLEELIVFETTLAVGQRPATFTAAITQARGALAPEAERAFALAIDIRRARHQRIRPLAGPGRVAATPTQTADGAGTAPFEPPPTLPEDRIIVDAVAPAGTRQERWQRQLLDLTLRNTLLNFRPGGRSVALLVPDPAALEDRLADGQEFRVEPLPPVMTGADPRDAATHQRRHGEDARRELAADAVEHGQLLAPCTPEELETRLVALYRAARADLQEGGSNTLFLALGFLKWSRPEQPQRHFLAPLVLLPVTLQRRTARSGFRLRLHEDEPRFNPTLLEMLRQDFAITLPLGEANLPRDDRGLDVAGIWTAVRTAIRDIPGWDDIVPEVALSTFSFAKYLMWKDLVDRAAVLRESPVVRHLFETPTAAYGDGATFPAPESLDAQLDPAATFCPLPADSSQLAAVAASARGKDFVLVGPPGTGKSQTIANLITHALASGRTVLFVAEKTAALEVVHKRLKAQGLGEFCLELHSHKARKTDVLAQLGAAWKAAGTLDQLAWEQQAAELRSARDRLNAFAGHLHRRHGNGLSARRAIEICAATRHAAAVTLTWPAWDIHDQAALAGLRDLVGRLAVNWRAAGGHANSALTLVARTEWSPQWAQNLTGAAHRLATAAQALERTTVALAQACGLPAGRGDAPARAAWLSLARTLPEGAGHGWDALAGPDGHGLRARLTQAVELLAQRAAVRQGLSLPYPDPVPGADIAALTARWQAAQGARWPRGWLGRRAVRAGLRALAGASKADPDCAGDLARLTELAALDAGLHAFEDFRTHLPALWNGPGSGAEMLRGALASAQACARAVGVLAADAPALTDAHARIAALLGPASALAQPGGAVATAAQRHLAAHGTFHEAAAAFTALATDGHAAPLDALALTDIATHATAIAAQEPALRDWCAWRRVREEASGAGLGPVVNGIESGALGAGDLADAFENAYARWWLGGLMEHDDVLRRFSSAEHERLIEQFRQLDDQHMALTRAYVRARLCAGLPTQAESERDREWGVLRRQLEMRRPSKPLRQLLGEIPGVVPRLAPCMLMSPLSVAQYLPAGAAPFDLVVFDEASQIPVWDAIGALARGRQAIIVGDPKQLPPTRFFNRGAEAQDDDTTDETDLESILDECQAARLPTLDLRWHYRSRHESLIAFSNHRYYGGQLITFPSPVVEDRAVRLHTVQDGQYERGGARTNPAEARRVVADVTARLRAAAAAGVDASVGVVTFNAQQQTLIEDLLDRERAAHPAIEPFFAENNPEAVLVKNLENVQGDERDAMYFSVTYGPDRAGHFTMNFGPLNQDGGQRRLNVAITRARLELHVYASFAPDRINLAQTQALGVRDLKHFLEYAQHGPRALAQATFGTLGDHESPLEAQVAAALAARGWEVVAQVGVSAFRIDLGVVHPDRPGAFLAGVECDGATYHRSATARDRDKLREQVLRGLGWTVLRVWSPDWWVDPAGVTRRLDAALHERLAVSRQATGAGAAATPAPPPDSDAAPGPAPSAATDSADPQPHVPTPDHSATGAAAVMPARDAPASVAASGAPPREVQVPSAIGADPPAPTDEPTSLVTPDPAAFFDPAYTPSLHAMIRAEVQSHGPLRADVLARRIARAHGFARTGARIRARVDALAGTAARQTEEDAGIFYWPDHLPADAAVAFRPPAPGEVRSADEVCAAELHTLAREVAASAPAGLEETEAVTRMARQLGIQAVHATARERLLRCWCERDGEPATPVEPPPQA